MKIFARSSLAAMIALMVWASTDARAIPAFARKYNVPCSSCHTGDFKLNDFGAAFDINGYQLPGTIERTPVWNSSSLPISLLFQDRVSMLSSTHTGSSAVDTTTKMFNSLIATIVTGGVIVPHVSLMSEIDFEDNGKGELIAGMEYAFLNFNNIFNTDRGEFDVRLGKMRMETLIEQTPEFYQSTYLIYQYPLLISGVPKSFWLSMPMYTAMVQTDIPYAPIPLGLTAAYTPGGVGNIDLSAAHLLYARLATDVEIGPVPLTLGVSGIFGGQAIDPITNDSLANDVAHIGVDWLIQQPYAGPFSLYGHIMKFHSTDVIAGVAGAQPQDALGGYFELNDVIVPERLTLQLRYDFLNSDLKTHTALGAEYTQQSINIAQYSMMLRYHLLPNMHLFVEGYLQDTQTQNSNNVTTSTATRSALFVSGGFFMGL